MACLDRQMYSSSDQMSPRISFSNDFAESTHLNLAARPPPPPISSDFEFSVANGSLQLPADELFSKGRILPLKSTGRFQKPPACSGSSATTTLRDELLAGDDEDEHGDGLSPLSCNKPPLKGRWKGFLGLRKHHFPAKKPTETPANSHAMFAFPLQDPNLSGPPQGGGSKGGDMEMKL